MRKVNEKMRGKRKKRGLANLVALFVFVAACMPVHTSWADDLEQYAGSWSVFLTALSTAIAAGGPQTITLTSNFDICQTVDIPENADITLDFSTRGDSSVTLTRATSHPDPGGGPLFRVHSGGTLTFLGRGTLQGDNAPPSAATGVRFLQLRGNDGWQNGPLVAVDAGGTFRAGHMYFQNNVTTGNGGAIHNAGTTLLWRCDINDTTATGNGGAIYNAGTGSLSCRWLLFTFLPSWLVVGVSHTGQIQGCVAAGNRDAAFDVEGAAVTGYGGAIYNEGRCVLQGWHYRYCVAFGGGGVANVAEQSTGGLQLGEAEGDAPIIAYCRAAGCSYPSQQPESWGEGNVLWNSGYCELAKLNLAYIETGLSNADFFVNGRHPIKLTADCNLPTGLRIAGFYYEDDDDSGDQYSTPSMWKLGADEPGEDNDFAIFDLNGHNLYNLYRPENEYQPEWSDDSTIVCVGTMPLVLDGTTGHVKVTGTEKIHPNLPRYSGRTLVVAMDPSSTVTGALTCELHDIFTGASITTPTPCTIQPLAAHTGDALALETTSPVAGRARELLSTADATQNYLVTLPETLAPGSYWLVIKEGTLAIGNIHINLADVEPPKFDEALVRTAADGALIVKSEGAYSYTDGTPVITFTLTDASGVIGLSGGVKTLRLTRPTASTNPLATDHVAVGASGTVTVTYPVSAEGSYIFEAIDYAGNRNSIKFTMIKYSNPPVTPPPGLGQLHSGGDTINNKYESHSQNDDSHDTYSESTTHETTMHHHYYPTEGTPEGTAPAGKTEDITHFKFLGGKELSNKTGKITPSKYLTEKALREANLDDVVIETTSESPGESGQSGFKQTVRDLLEAIKKEREAAEPKAEAETIPEVSPPAVATSVSIVPGIASLVAPAGVTGSPAIGYTIAPVSFPIPAVNFAAAAKDDRTSEEKAADAKAMMKFYRKQRNLDTDLISKHSILTKAKKKYPEIFIDGTDLQLLTFGDKKALAEPFTFRTAPDEISLALKISLPYRLFKVTSKGTMVEELPVLKMTKGTVSWQINTKKYSFIIKETPIAIMKNKKYQATDFASFEMSMAKLKEALKGSTKLLLNGEDTMAVIKSSSVLASKATGTLDLTIDKLKPENYNLDSKTSMIFDLGDLGKLQSDITLYIGAKGLGLGGQTFTIYGADSQGKAVAIGTTTVSRTKQIAKIVIKADVAKKIGKAKS
ncbi:hypothetical protein FACS1894198_3490 [Clostridia bacterium]|nr:hypothetical protein FACS1894198_3490 [Clostridia bacterium]